MWYACYFRLSNCRKYTIIKRYATTEMTSSQNPAILGTLLRIAAPIAVMMMLLLSNYFCAQLILTQLSVEALLASPMISIIIFFINVLNSSLFYMVFIEVTTYISLKKPQYVGQLFRESVLLSLCISGIIMLLIALVSHIALGQTGLSLQAQSVIAFFSTFVYAIPLINLLFIFVFFFIGMRAFLPAVLMLVFNVIITSYLSVAWCFGQWGFTPLGIQGIGYANVVGYAVPVGIGVVLLTGSSFKPYQFFAANISPYAQRITHTLWSSWPIGVQLCSDLSSFFLLTLFVTQIDPMILATHQACFQMLVLTMMIPMSIGPAASMLVNKALIAKDWQRVRKVCGTMHRFMIIIMSLLMAIYVIFHHELIHFILSSSTLASHQVTELASQGFYLMLFLTSAHFFYGLKQALVNVLRGLYDTRYAMVVSVLTSYVIILPTFLILLWLHCPWQGYYLALMLIMALQYGLIYQRVCDNIGHQHHGAIPD